MASKIHFLKKTSEYTQLKENGQKFWAAPWLLVSFKRVPGSEEIRIGITASRFVGPAVVRNRLKRWVRQYFRESSIEPRGNGFDCNFIFKATSKELFRELSYAEFTKAMEKFLKFALK